MKHISIITATVFTVISLFLACSFVGCENDHDSASISSGYVIHPATKTISATSATNIQFAISGGVPGYSWSVNDPSLGSVVGVNNTGIYSSTTNVGQNFVIVTDSTSNSVSATINQN